MYICKRVECRNVKMEMEVKRQSVQKKQKSKASDEADGSLHTSEVTNTTGSTTHLGSVCWPKDQVMWNHCHIGRISHVCS